MLRWSAEPQAGIVFTRTATGLVGFGTGVGPLGGGEGVEGLKKLNAECTGNPGRALMVARSGDQGGGGGECSCCRGGEGEGVVH